MAGVTIAFLNRSEGVLLGTSPQFAQQFDKEGGGL